MAAELPRIGFSQPLDRATLDRALDHLVEWGNLRRSHDTARVATLEDFRRRHFLCQLTQPARPPNVRSARCWPRSSRADLYSG